MHIFCYFIRIFDYYLYIIIYWKTVNVLKNVICIIYLPFVEWFEFFHYVIFKKYIFKNVF